MSPQTSFVFDDNHYPVEPIWVLKSTLVSLIFLPIFILIFSPVFLTGINFSTSSSGSIKGLTYAIFYILFIPIHFFVNVLRRATFHYNFEEKFLNLNQGIIRKQNRQIPYGVIQNVIVTRGLLDRLFGLSTITIQNASPSAISPANQRAANQIANTAGFFGNTVNIPGLTTENAQEIKQELLNRIKRSPIRELGM